MISFSCIFLLTIFTYILIIVITVYYYNDLGYGFVANVAVNLESRFVVNVAVNLLFGWLINFIRKIALWKLASSGVRPRMLTSEFPGQRSAAAQDLTPSFPI